jgi:hypothetical protein
MTTSSSIKGRTMKRKRKRKRGQGRRKRRRKRRKRRTRGRKYVSSRIRFIELILQTSRIHI